MWPSNTGDCQIEVITGLTVYIYIFERYEKKV
jgi:hypothetical protein